MPASPARIWPVNPTYAEIAGHRCYKSIADLPEAPDATFIAVPRELTIEMVRDLAARGAGGAVCYAAGFAEVGGEGIALQTGSGRRIRRSGAGRDPIATAF